MVEASLNIVGLTASEFNTVDNKKKFTTAVEASLTDSLTGKVTVYDVVATVATSRRMLQTSSSTGIDVSFKIKKQLKAQERSETAFRRSVLFVEC